MTVVHQLLNKLESKIVHYELLSHFSGCQKVGAEEEQAQDELREVVPGTEILLR